MKKYYNLMLLVLAVVLGSTAYGQCPTGVSISAGGYTDGGNNFVCDGTSVTVEWTASTDPNTTGYRLRVGNNAAIDNLSATYVEHTGPGTYSSTFAVPAATNGDFYSFTVDYSVDPSWTVGNAATRVYQDCIGDAQNFKVSVDPTDVVSISLTGGDNVSDVCYGQTFTLTATGGMDGDLSYYEWSTDNFTSTIAGESMASYVVDGGITTGTTYYVRRADSCGVVTSTVMQAITVSGNEVSGITESEQAIISGATVCPGDNNPDLTFNATTFTAGSDIAWELVDTTDGGSISVTTGTGNAFNVDLDAYTDGGKDFIMILSNASCPYNTFPVDTFAFSTNDVPNLTSTFDGFSVEELGELQAINAGNTTVSICTGQNLVVDLKSLGSAVGTDLLNTSIELYNVSTASTIDGPDNLIVWSGNDSVLTVVDVFAAAALSGDVIEVRINRCGYGGPSVISSRQFVLDENTNPTAGTSSLSILREDNATPLNNNDKVCSNELLDIDLLQGTASLGTGGLLKLYKITATDTTLLGSAAGDINILNHDHGAVAATYLGVIVSNCDSIVVANTPSLTADVFITSGNLTSFSFADTAALADNKACIGQSLTLQTTPSTIGDDGATVTFYYNAVSGTLDGNEVSIGAGTLSGGVYSRTTTHSNGNVWYIAELTSDCNSGSEIASMLISDHDETVTAPTKFDISEVAFSGVDLGEDITMANDTANPICAGTEVFFTTDGDLLTSDDGSRFYWEIDTTSNGAASAWVGLDTTMVGQLSVTLNDTANIRVRIDGGCNPATSWVFATINLKTSSDTFDVTYADASLVANTAPFFNINYNTGTNTATDSICASESFRFGIPGGINYAGATDNPTTQYRFNGVTQATDNLTGVVFPNAVYNVAGPNVGEGSHTIWFKNDCDNGGAYIKLAEVNLTYLDENVQDPTLDARLADMNDMGTAVADNQPVCPGTEVTFYNDGTLGEATNGRTAAQYVFVYDNGGGPVTVMNGMDSSLTLTINATTTVESYISGGCNGAMAPTSATFTVNVISSQSNFTSISLTQDNYCADEASTLAVTMTANGAALVYDDTTRVVWYSMNDAGDPVSKIKTTYAGNAGADQLLFNGGDGPAPDTTTTIGVRLEGCDTTAFEVRTITVKDLPQNKSESGAAAVVSASPNAVCSGSSSTLNIINYILGANGQVTWYDDMAGTTLLGTGPSYTAANITSDTTFYVRIEADCDTTAMLSVDVNLSTVNPTPATDLDVPVFICEGENIVVTASGSTGDGSYIWEVSFDGVVFSSISDGSPGDNMLSYSANNLTYTNNVANVTLRVSRTNGCITTAGYSETFEVRQNPDALTAITPEDPEVCINGAAITIGVSGGDAGFDGMIKWYIEKQGGADSSVTAWDNMSSVSFDWNMFDGDGVYDIWAQYESTACGSYSPDSVLTTVTVYPLPTNDLADPIASVCSNDEVSLKGLSAFTGPNQSYMFSGPGVADTMYVAADGSFAGSLTGGTETITYMVTENGCSQTFSVEIEVFGTPVIAGATPTIASCNTADGTIKVEVVNGGDSPFLFAVDGETAFGFGADSIITGLTGGDKDVLVQDANGCISDAFEVTVPSSNNFAVVVDTTIQESCFEAEDGAIEVSVSGGLTPYSYEVLRDGQTIMTQSGLTSTKYVFDDLIPGVYQIIFTDNGGCDLSVSKTINAAGQLGLTVNDFDDIACFGDATGKIGGLVATSTNNGPFEFSLNGGAFTTDTEFTGLTAGDYEITVRDSKACERTFLFTLEEPTELTIEPVVFDTTETGYDVAIIPGGGTADYEYSNGGAFQADSIYTNLSPATYTFVVRDANGCLADSTVTLDEIVSIGELNGVFAGVTASPNPFSNELTISGISEDVEITLTDMTGKQVDYVAVVRNNKATVTTSNLASGVYFLNLTLGNETATVKLLKN